MKTMLSSAVVVIAFFLTVSNIAAGARASLLYPRVINGRDDDGKYPFVVLFYESAQRTCTGSLISNEWVLTAAHCEIDNKCVAVYANFTVPLQENNYQAKVLKTFPHQRAFRNKLSNDIALVKIERVNASSFGILHSADYKSLMGRPVTQCGFGATYRDHILHKHPKKVKQLDLEDDRLPLQVADGVIAKCSLDIPQSLIAHATMSAYLCVKRKCVGKRTRPSNGDSGGPLLYRGQIVGVASMIRPETYYEAFYTAVSPYIPWIQHVISSN